MHIHTIADSPESASASTATTDRTAEPTSTVASGIVRVTATATTRPSVNPPKNTEVSNAGPCSPPNSIASA